MVFLNTIDYDGHRQWLSSKESACNTGDQGSIPGSGRSPGEGKGYPLQYSCLENSMDRGDWQTTVHGVTESQRRLSDEHFHFSLLAFNSGDSVKKENKKARDWGRRTDPP